MNDVSRILFLAGRLDEGIEEVSDDSSIFVLDVVHQKLEADNWCMTLDTNNSEVWQHCDEPAAGQYIIKKDDDGSVLSIRFTNPRHHNRIWDDSFKSEQEFFNHLERESSKYYRDASVNENYKLVFEACMKAIREL